MGDQPEDHAASSSGMTAAGLPSGGARVSPVDLKRMLVAHDRAANGGAETGADIEGAISDDEPLAEDNKVLDRLDTHIAAQSEAAEDREKFVAARDVLLRYSEPALKKLVAGNVDLSENERGALEAIIIVDGTRPSFLLCDGLPAMNDPTMGTWLDMVSAHRFKTQRIARAVGRIQPTPGSAAHYFGTGSLIDAAKGLVLTNYHVIADAKARGVAMTMTDRTITVQGGLEIDFAGEACSLRKSRYKIVSIDLPDGYGPGFGRIDAAIARIEAMPDSEPLPEAVPALSAFPAYADGGMTSFATIGFPGPPPLQQGVVDGVDWGMIAGTLFRNIFGCKRLAPGTLGSPLGSRADDVSKTAFGHNATTFGGASGSLLSAWADTDGPCFGLHFFGNTQIENNALAFAAVPDALEAVGVRFA